MSKEALATVRRHAAHLAAARTAGVGPEAETMRWLTGVSPALRNRLAKAGLCDPAPPPSALIQFFDGWAAEKPVKASTALTYGRARGHLLGFFDSTVRLGAIDPGEAERFDQWLRRPRDHLEGGKGLAENSARKTIGIMKQVFETAKKRRLVQENPFEDLASSSTETTHRQFFVPMAWAFTLMSLLPDDEWRLLLALARIGGLRIPSEPRQLRRGHVNLQTMMLTVPSPKTEHHPGHETRELPIFPELLPFIEQAMARTAGGGEDALLLPFLQGRTNASLVKPMRSAIGRAGLKQWPKLFQNLRSSRETELADHFPLQAVVKWIGNSVAVARKSYLQLTDPHLHAAVTRRTAGGAEPLPAPIAAASAPAPVAEGAARNGSPPEAADMEPDAKSDAAGGRSEAPYDCTEAAGAQENAPERTQEQKSGRYRA